MPRAAEYKLTVADSSTVDGVCRPKNSKPLDLSTISKEIPIALSLANHPFVNSRLKYRKKYILALKYFIDLKFSNSVFAQRRLDLYAKVIAREIEVEGLNPKKYHKAFKYSLKRHFTWFRFFTFRYMLLVDLLTISGALTERSLHTVLKEISQFLSLRKRVSLEGFLLGSSSFADKKADAARNLLDRLNENIFYHASEENRVIITGTMSSGKSTLINALVGKKVAKTMSSVCTEAVHYIYDKAFEDGYTIELDHELILDADEQILMDNHEDNKSGEIHVGTYFNFNKPTSRRVCLVDIPGVNSSQYPAHQQIARNAILNTNFDTLIYVLNADYLGTDDERTHLDFIFKNCDHSKIVFVVNKIDNEDIDDSPVIVKLQNLWNELQEIGFRNPAIYPISGRFSYLLKKQIQGKEFTNSENREIKKFYDIFNEIEYDLSKYNTTQQSDNIFYKVGYQQLEERISGQ